MQTKPDSSHIKALIAQADAVCRGLHASAMDTQRNEIAAIRRAADAFYKQKLQAALEEQFASYENGGEIVAEGTPEEVAKCKKSYTGKYLKPLFL